MLVSVEFADAGTKTGTHYVRFVAVASPEYLARHEMPRAPRDLLHTAV